MIIDARYRIDKIAGATERDILKHVLITEWQDEPVAVAADGYLLAVVPVEMEDGDQPGLLHVSILDHARPEFDDSEFEWLERDWPITIGLGSEQASFADGWSAPRTGPKGSMDYPNWQKVMYELANGETDVSPGFSVMPERLHQAAEAIGTRAVTIHRTVRSDEQIILTPIGQKALEPPFAVLMLAKAPNGLSGADR